MEKEIFTAELEPIGPSDSLTCVRIPFSVKHVFGIGGRVTVTGTVNGVPFESALEVEGDGTHTMLVPEAALRSANLKAGDQAEIALQPKG
jgi:hypothetical protein